jgi:hypothetical protein
MRRLWIPALALVCGLGCAADGDKGSWDEVRKDLRGDNMQMRSTGAAIGGWGNNQHSGGASGPQPRLFPD